MDNPDNEMTKRVIGWLLIVVTVVATTLALGLSAVLLYQIYFGGLFD
jgi:hypothetical protein